MQHLFKILLNAHLTEKYLNNIVAMPRESNEATKIKTWIFV